MLCFRSSLTNSCTYASRLGSTNRYGLSLTRTSTDPQQPPRTHTAAERKSIADPRTDEQSHPSSRSIRRCGILQRLLVVAGLKEKESGCRLVYICRSAVCHAPLWLCHFTGVTDGWPDGWNQLTPGRRTIGVPIRIGVAYPDFAISNNNRPLQGGPDFCVLSSKEPVADSRAFRTAPAGWDQARGDAVPYRRRLGHFRGTTPIVPVLCVALKIRNIYRTITISCKD